MPKKKLNRKKTVQRTLRIFCEGEKTEPNYLREYIRYNRDNHLASVVSVEKCSKNTPVQLVDVAIAAKNSGKSVKGDEFWVVYDREAVAKYDRALHAKAWQTAKNNDIKIALSNVCFEFWILLHLVDSSAAYSSFDDLKNRSPLLRELSTNYAIDYEKSSATLYEALKDQVPVAMERADRINQHGLGAAGHQDKPFDVNPYTDVPELLRAIVKF